MDVRASLIGGFFRTRFCVLEFRVRNASSKAEFGAFSAAQVWNVPWSSVSSSSSKGWRMPPHTVRVARSTIYGNPFTTENCEGAQAVGLFRDSAAQQAAPCGSRCCWSKFKSEKKLWKAGTTYTTISITVRVHRSSGTLYELGQRLIHFRKSRPATRPSKRRQSPPPP